MLIGKNLNLHVARTFDVLLDIDRIVAKRILCFALRRIQRARNFGGVTHDPHPLAATTRGRFEKYRIAELLGDGRRFFRITKRFRRTRHNRNAMGDRQSSSSCF